LGPRQQQRRFKSPFWPLEVAVFCGHRLASSP
jgi:hypothetical protein